jgi:Xaa-Pro aminopeptidase
MNLVTLWRRGITSLWPTGKASQVNANSGVERSDRRQPRRGARKRLVDHAQWFIDRMDVRRLKRMVLMLERTQGTRAWFEEPIVRNRIHEILRQELHEPDQDFDDGLLEETWRRDDLGRDYLEGRGAAWDARRDLRESEESRKRLAREIEILNRLRQIQPAVDHGRKARFEEDRLLASFLKLAKEDERADRRDRRHCQHVQNGDHAATPTAR